MAILPETFTVEFKDRDIFDISKQPTKRVCWALDKTELVEPNCLEAMTKKIALIKA